MTALTAPAPSAARPAVPWTRLVWVTWRQHRAALAGVGALLGGLGLYLLVMGLRIRAAYAVVTACRPAGSAACQDASFLFNSAHYGAAQTVSGLLQGVPVLVGVFAGAPLFAHELESGTFRFAWTQGCGRTRWVLAKLVPLAAVLAAAAGAFSLLFSWYYHPFRAVQVGVLAPQLFDLRSVAFAAWTLAAFAIGAFAGVVIRRTVPAMAATLATWTGLDLATMFYLRPRYAAPVIARGFMAEPSASGIPVVISQWWTGPDGHVLGPGAMGAVISQMKLAVGGNAANQIAMQWLAQRHYFSWISYQPASRFWTVQLIEGGWLLALVVLLGAATVWLVRRRDA